LHENKIINLIYTQEKTTFATNIILSN